MKIIDNYEGFKYTKIYVPIYLNECPSDDENNRCFIDLACDEYTQQNCYIGNQFVEQISVKRVQKVENIKNNTICAKWNVEIILPVVKMKMRF